MKHSHFLISFLLISSLTFAQKKTTTSARIIFDATTNIDKLPKAENRAVVAAIHTKKGTVQFEAPIKNFSFSNPKIMEHFNQKGWMNSEEFPVAIFSGVLSDVNAINFRKNGTYQSSVTGDLTVRGRTNKISAPVTFEIENNIIIGNCAFTIKLADYGIDGPAVGAGKVSSEPKISIKAEFKQ